MARALLLRGMLAGAVAGVLMWAFSRLFGEGPLERAIAYEEARAGPSAAAGLAVEAVSRGVQSTIGLALALLVYGVAVGGLFALVFAGLHGRLGRVGPRAAAAALAATGYVVGYVVPFLKYPANPPASSVDGTIGPRTGFYLIMVIASLVVATAAVWLGRRLAAKLGDWNGGIAAAIGYLVVVSLVMLGLPTMVETPADFPATVLYEFRIASLGNQAVLWSTLGLLFGWMAERTLAPGTARRRRAEAVG